VSYFTVDAIDTEWGKSNKIASSSILGAGSLRRRKGSGALKEEIGV